MVCHQTGFWRCHRIGLVGNVSLADSLRRKAASSTAPSAARPPRKDNPTVCSSPWSPATGGVSRKFGGGRPRNSREGNWESDYRDGYGRDAMTAPGASRMPTPRRTLTCGWLIPCSKRVGIGSSRATPLRGVLCSPALRHVRSLNSMAVVSCYCLRLTDLIWVVAAIASTPVTCQVSCFWR